MTILNTQLHKLVVKIMFVVMLLSAVILVEGQTSQKITFYSLNNKGGTNISFIRGEDITPQTPTAYNAGSYCVEQGLWIMTVTTTGSTEPIMEWIGGNLGGENCVNQPPEGRNYLKVRAVGELNLEKSVLSVFPQKRWEREEDVLEIEGEEPDEDMTILSYVLTGRVSYEIFPEADFEGVPICLAANAPSHLNYGIASSFSTNIVCRSARPGCGTGGVEDGGNRTTTERGSSDGISHLSSSISKFFHFINLVLFYFSRKILF